MAGTPASSCTESVRLAPAAAGPGTQGPVHCHSARVGVGWGGAYRKVQCPQWGHMPTHSTLPMRWQSLHAPTPHPILSLTPASSVMPCTVSRSAKDLAGCSESRSHPAMAGSNMDQPANSAGETLDHLTQPTGITNTPAPALVKQSLHMECRLS